MQKSKRFISLSSILKLLSSSSNKQPESIELKLKDNKIKLESSINKDSISIDNENIFDDINMF